MGRSNSGRAGVATRAPDFKGIAVVDGQLKKIKLSDYKGKYVVVFFYPGDFSYVCPTEIVSFSERLNEFRLLNTELVAVSTDSHFSHLAWWKTSRKYGGIADTRVPLLSDKAGIISRSYGVFNEDDGTAFRALFIIDDKGTVRQITINDVYVGRSIDETIRIVKALQLVDKYGDVCPADWVPGEETFKPDLEGSRTYFHKQ